MDPQRLRITFGKGQQVKYISHLDLVRAWERALRRADVKLAYSHGFNPRPKLVFAAALPVGFSGRAELMDVTLERRMELREFASRVEAQLPAGLGLLSAVEVSGVLPSLPSQVMAAEYEVRTDSTDAPEQMQAALGGLLLAERIPRRRQRRDGSRAYDLRPLIQTLSILGRCRDGYVIGMRLQAGEHGTGRPDEVMAALSMSETVCSIERVRLVLQPALLVDLLCSR